MKINNYISIILFVFFANILYVESYNSTHALEYSFTWCNKDTEVNNLPADYGYNVPIYNDQDFADHHLTNLEFKISTDNWRHDSNGWFKD